MGFSLTATLVLIGMGAYSFFSQSSIEETEVTETETEISSESEWDGTPQIGVNFIPVNLDTAPGTKSLEMGVYDDPAWLADAFNDLGVQMYRQTTEADMFWKNIQPKENVWRFDTPDEMLEASGTFRVATLFDMQYASPTPPWETDPAKFQKTLGDEAKVYLDAVLDRYGDQITYWEIGNEMDHWRAADSTTGPQGASALPAHAPSDGFSPYEQGVFLAEVSEYIKSKDSDAVILLPGMSGVDDYLLDVWLEGVIEGGGTEFFDIMNYHYYYDYKGFENARERLASKMDELGIADKPVWLTETGVTSDSKLTIRTNYPNSETTQASDVFRRLIQAYAAGDSLVLWHTHLSSSDEGSQGDWRAYGLRKSTGEAKKAWYSFKLFTDELIPFTEVEKMTGSSKTQYVYKISFADSDEVKYVAWGTGALSIPEGVSKYTSVVLSGTTLEWASVSGTTLTLSDIPVLLK